MDCAYYNARQCASCALIETPYAGQIDQAQQQVAASLGLDVNDLALPVRSAESGFRNKAKMVASGIARSPLLGIVDRAGHGTDLSCCPLYPEAMHEALDVLKGFITRARLVPYSIVDRTGELKHVLVTISPDEQIMVRFVLRSTEPLARIKKYLPTLQSALPSMAVATVNVLPEHKAALEGEREIFLTEQTSLPMRLRDVTLHLRPRSFFQTNTELAQALYDHARALAEPAHPATVWDLYCGVGGFALHLAPVSSHVTGVEISDEAIASAELSAATAGLDNTEFIVGDATEFATAQLGRGITPDLVVVNPPRRGIGSRLAALLNESSVGTVLYSSCNPTTLARDLTMMDSYVLEHVELLDMFPHTSHNEVLVCLRKRL